MQFKLKLQTKGELRLSPQMQYALTLLQMDSSALLGHVQQQAMENPLISMDSLPLSSSAAADWSEVSQQAQLPDLRAVGCLREDLLEQLDASLEPELEQAVCRIIDLLDDNGFLSVPQDRLSQELNLPSQLADRALQYLQSMEPAGVGAGSVEESLLLQLRRLPEATPLAMEIAENYLSDIAAGRLRKIARAQHIPFVRVEEAAALIRSLNPHPANGYRRAEESRYIVPEVVISVDDRQARATIAENALLSLRLDNTYLELLANDRDSDLVSYLKERKAAFTCLEQGITIRNTILLSVSQIIARQQKAFFLDRDALLQPLSLKEISQELDIHISTVSKAIKDKYLICPHGVYPLRRFICRYTAGGQEEETPVGQDQVCQAIRALIAAEDPAAPYSDQQLFALLEKQGLIHSRRAVAYYRQKLGIPVSYARQKRGGSPQ